jgi:hypothetical protein
MKIRAVLLSAVVLTIIVTMWTRDPHTLADVACCGVSLVDAGLHSRPPPRPA